MARVDHLVQVQVAMLLERIMTDHENSGCPQTRVDQAPGSAGPQGHRRQTASPRIDTARASIDRATDLRIQRVIEQAAYERAVQRAQADADAAHDELEALRHAPRAQPLTPLTRILEAVGS